MFPPGMDIAVLESVDVSLAGADAHGLGDRRNEDLAVADLSGLRGGADRLDDPVGLFVGHRNLDANFWQEVHRIFGAAINLGVALLPAVTLDLGGGTAVNDDGEQGIAPLLELEWLDDGNDELHEGYPLRDTGKVCPHYRHCARNLSDLL